MDKIDVLLALQILEDNLVRLARRYRYVGLTVLLVVSSSLIVDIARTLLGRGVVVALSLSRQTPWGIVTSMLVHGDFYHLYNNLQGFLLYSALIVYAFALENIFINDSEKSSRGQVTAYILTVVMSQVVPATKQYFEFVLATGSILAYGLSQVVFGLLGLLGASIFVPLSMLIVTAIERGGRINALLKLAIVSSLSASFFQLTILAVGVQRFLQFIGVGIPEANVEGHMIAFISGIILGSVTLALKHSDLEFTLSKLRKPKEHLGVEESRERLLIKISRVT